MSEQLLSSVKNKTIFGMIALFLVLMVANLLLSRPNPDEGIHMMGGWLLLNGTVLYSELFSMYAPGSYFILAAFYSLFPADFVVSRLLMLAVNLGSLVAFFALCRKLLDERASLIALFFYVVWSVFTISWNVLMEPFMTLFAILLVYFVLTYLESKKLQDLALAGLFIASIVMMKQTMLFFSTAALFFLIIKARPSLKEYAVLGVSYALLPLLFLYYLFSNNAFFDFVDQAILYNLAHSSLFAFRFHLGWIAVTALFVSVFALAALLFLSKKLRIKKDKGQLLFIWIVLTLPTLLPVLGCCHHHLPLVPGFVILFTLAFDSVFFKGDGFSLKGFDAKPLLKGFLALVFVASIVGSGIYLSQYFFQNDFEDLFEVAEFVNENSSPEDKIHVTYWDEEVYFFALRKPATRYLYHPFLFEAEEKAFQAEVVQALEDEKAIFVVDFARDDEPMQSEGEMSEYILENYSLVKTQEMDPALYNTFNYGFVLQRNE